MALILWLFVAFTQHETYGQNYNNILNHRGMATPVNGVKIKTNLPYISGSYMPTIFIDGYSYGKAKTISLKFSFYIYNGNFISSTISSSGGDVPKVQLSNEDNKVVIFIDNKVYFQQLTVSAFCMVNPATGAFQGWTVADEAITGTNTVEIPYSNAFGGDVNFKDGIWSKTGNVGIGTITPAEKLSVNGNIRAKEVKVETANWPDYVFKPSYSLMPLSKVESFIKANGHLPDIPSAKEIEQNGMEVGANQVVLLKKIEELTLHLIEMEKKVENISKDNERIKKQLNRRLKQ
ncbi:hypothetical protein A8C56_10050 [Niabella ginsenosidivorans]|uniref:Peptidase S74 domain-containing protein n=2 Tax=Niabella ginsenosidivorans TaxID=1176587 RepID=A0A1A9I3L8_9BACT|nr:hypothetical protein A8C56_10050 [Niabella ginsenosidivorans]